jgi:hypothetical protein
MPKKATSKNLQTIVMPEATAHIVTRELTFSSAQLARLQAALDAKKPLKMNLGLHSKVWGVVARPQDDDDEIVDQELVPPDEGGDIPEDEEEEPQPPIGSMKGRKLVGAKIKVYAVAVFQPKFQKVSKK